MTDVHGLTDGLRLRRSALSAAHNDQSSITEDPTASPVAPPSKDELSSSTEKKTGSQEDVVKGLPHSAWRRPSGTALVAALCLALGALIGIAGGVYGTVLVIGTAHYPRADLALGRFLDFMNIHFEVELDDEDALEIVSCTDDQPLVERKDNVIDADTFKRMQNCLVGHPMITTNHLNPEGFSGTRGFVIKFDHKGVDRFLNEERFSCDGFNPLVPFFEKARHPETNGFVMNVLVCDKPSNKSGLVVGTHVDDTLGHHRPKVDFLAHTVSVLYLNVPEDMEGGELEILGGADVVYQPDYDESVDPPLEVITPTENTYAEFRGDAFHRVRGYDTSTDTLRISLVLEQYKLSKLDQQFLTEYEQSEKDGMTMM